MDTLVSVAATSATDAWAVGTAMAGTGIGQTMILHWNGVTRYVPPEGPAHGEGYWIAASVWYDSGPGGTSRTRPRSAACGRGTANRCRHVE
jgi:hypothetical protein